MARYERITSESADLQVLEALLHNRRKRTQRGEFLIEGVQAVNRALAHGWPVRAVLVPAGATPSSWAAETTAAALDAHPAARHVAVRADLFARLTDRQEAPELLLVGEIVGRPLAELHPPAGAVVVVVDRPSSPGNLGTILRTSDALGAAAVVTVGHGAHLFDPRVVRASVGSLFALPATAASGPAEVATWLAAWRERAAVTVYATDEHGDRDVLDGPLRRPAVLLLGTERTGLARGLRDLADVTLRIPMAGSASSLNVAVAHGIALHALTR
ncbi:MAG: TrmH family RNA methyltransferase [Acidimicrobiales bacterium]|nr:TrmH family RNA methyltransferase [Acidimicrobiales bacterium]